MARPPAQMVCRWPQIKAAQMARAQMVRFYCTVLEVADEVVGWSESGGRKKGNAWWIGEIKDAVERKKRA